MAGRLEAPHGASALAHRLVGIFGAVIEVAMLPMFHSREDFPLCRPISLEFIRNDHA